MASGGKPRNAMAEPYVRQGLGRARTTLPRMADLRLGELVDPATHQRAGSPLTLDTADFTTHGVIVGMTGSGKTGLGIVLIEEALSAGVPCILIDPKGDLANLALIFPDLAPA